MAPQSAGTERTQPPAGDARAGAAASWGLAVAELSDADREELRGASGVKVTAVSGGARAAGLRAGDIILGVGTSEVATVGQFEAALARIDKTRPLPVTVLRGGWAQFVRIPALR